MQIEYQIELHQAIPSQKLMFERQVECYKEIWWFLKERLLGHKEGDSIYSRRFID